MLKHDKNERISVAEILNTPYALNYYKDMTQDQVRAYMQ